MKDYILITYAMILYIECSRPFRKDLEKRDYLSLRLELSFLSLKHSVNCICKLPDSVSEAFILLFQASLSTGQLIPDNYNFKPQQQDSLPHVQGVETLVIKNNQER